MAGDGVYWMLRAVTPGHCNDRNEMLEPSIQKASTGETESYCRDSCYNSVTTTATTECCNRPAKSWKWRL